jgi:hypothetical protein
MAIVLMRERPAILVSDGTFHSTSDSSWTEVLERHRGTLERSINGVGRLETADTVMPFIGTAFVIDKRLAVTASICAELLTQRHQRNSADDYRLKLDDPRINFKAEHGIDGRGAGGRGNNRC